MKRTQKYMSSEAHGYLREAEACSLVLKDLEHISASLWYCMAASKSACLAAASLSIRRCSLADMRSSSLRTREQASASRK